MKSNSNDFKKYVFDTCDNHLDKVFLEQFETDQKLTYAEFKEQINNMSLELNLYEPVVLMMENTINSIVLLFFLLINGIKPILVKKNITENELIKICSTLQVNKKISYSDKLYVEQILIETSEFNEINILPTIAYFVFTSGSTGTAKCIQLSYDNVISEIKSMARAYDLDDTDVHLCLLPIYHASGLYRNVLMAFDRGARAVIVKNFNCNNFWNILNTSNITFTQITPSIIRNLLSIKKRDFLYPRKLKYIGSASELHPKKLVKKFEATFKVPLAIGYGMTEATCGITLNRVFPRVNYSVGKAIDIVDLKIINKEGDAVGVDQVGEIVISGENIMEGYFNHESNDKIMYKNKCLFSGDLGYLDKNGNLFIVGRKNHIVKRGGYRINISEIEISITSLSYIQECTIIDIPHSIIGVDIIAFVSLKDQKEIKSREILSDLKQILDQTKMPSEIIIVENIPKLDGLKVNMSDLQNQYISILEKRKIKRSNV